MGDQQSAGPLQLLPVQIIETSAGVLLKRGAVEVRVLGPGATELVNTIIHAASEPGITTAQICALFAEPDQPRVRDFVELLLSRRVLVDVDSETSAGTGLSETPLDVFYWQLGVSSRDAKRSLDQAAIAVAGVNEVSMHLARSLLACGVSRLTVIDDPTLRNMQFFEDDGPLLADRWGPLPTPVALHEWTEEPGVESVGCIVATSDFGGLYFMRRWNELCVEHERRFLPVVLQDLVGHVGPLVVPGETPCFECAYLRRNAQQQDPMWHRASELVALEGQSIIGYHPAMPSVLGGVAAVELTTSLLPTTLGPAVGRVLELRLLGGEMTSHAVLRLPRCPVCSQLSRRSPVRATREPDWIGNQEQE
jgi:bacteriocin biosynthesis cyclodehydratase domain-containing protein